MKTLKDILESRKKTIVMSFGRMNPPTSGHELLVKAVVAVAHKNDADHIIYVSKSQDPKKNPLTVDQKVAYARHSFKGANIIGASDRVRTFLEAAADLSKKYDNLIMVVGSDRVNEFKTLLDQYNGKNYNFSSIVVASAGERDPDNDSVSGMSATKMRQAAAENDFAKFKRGVPSGMNAVMARRMFDDVRSGMNITEEYDPIREAYLKEELFRIGDIVMYEDEEHTIIHRGSNYVMLENNIRAWLKDIKPTEKVNESIMIRQQDKIRAARIIAMALGYEEAEDKTNPSLIVNNALRIIRSKALNPEAKGIIKRMLELATKMSIEYDQKLVDALRLETNIQEEGHLSPEEQEAHNLMTNPGKAHKNNHERLAKIKLKTESEESEEEFDEEGLEDSLTDDEVIEHGYEDSEFHIIDPETGEKIEDFEDQTNEAVLNEVLSRIERMRAKVRMARTKAKRERAAQIALKRYSNAPTLAKRARRLAVKAIEKKLAKKPLSSLSVTEKERIEARIKTMGNTITRVAAKMLSRVRTLEKTRLSGNKK